MKVAYLVNQYPKVSHSFIRREILALERAGVEVVRFSGRGWADDLVDEQDLRERGKTTYLLRHGLRGLLAPTLARALAAPGRFVAALRIAREQSRMSPRGFAYHLAYVAQACHLVGLMKRAGTKHLHAHFGTNSAEIAMLARELGGPAYSFTVHGPEEFDNPAGLHLAEKMARAKFVVAISSFGRSQLYRWLGAAQWDKVRVVHCGLEEGFRDADPTPAPTSKKLVCVGRLCEQKGQLLLLRAAKALLDEGQVFELVLAGDGEMRTEIESFIRANSMQRSVTITGWVDSSRVRREIENARALVLASFGEGLPVVLMEAMALARPVVTTSIAGIPELVRDGREGWVIPAGDLDALVAALRQVLSATADELQAMGARGRERVLARHDIDHEAGKLATLFSKSD